MYKVIHFIPQLILSRKDIFFWTVILSFLLLFQFSFHHHLQTGVVVWEGVCSFERWDQIGPIGMVIDCGEHGIQDLDDSDTIRSYLNNPGPLMCRISAASTTDCELHP